MRRTVLAGVLSLAFAITAAPAASGSLASSMPPADDPTVTQVAKKGGGGGRSGIRAGGPRGGNVRGKSARFYGRHVGGRHAHAGVRRGHVRRIPRQIRRRLFVRCGWRGGSCYRNVRYWPRYDRYDRDNDVGVETSYPAYCPARGTLAWHAVCASKYDSYKPWTGTYTTRSGGERYCVCP
jgi:BA14K-like protein